MAVPGAQARSELRGELAAAYALAGEMDAASAIVASISDDSVTRIAWCNIMAAQARSGDIAGAKAAAAAANLDACDKAPLYRQIAQIQAEAGDIAGARRTAVGIADARCKTLAWRTVPRIPPARRRSRKGGRRGRARIVPENARRPSLRVMACVGAICGLLSGHESE
jgi:hypothetical protein